MDTQGFNMYKLRIILAMFIFGTLGLFVKNINLASSEIAFWRAVIAIVVLSLCLIFSKRKSKRKIDEKRAVRLFVSGAIMGFNWILLFESYKFTSIAVATLCYYFEPVIVVAASFFMFNEKIGIKKAVCFGFATLGLVMVVLSSQTEGGGFMGAVLALGAAALYAAVVIINKSIQDIDDIERTLFQFLAAAFVIAPYVLITGGFAIKSIDTKGALCLAVLGVIHTGFAYLMYFSAVPKVSGQQASIFGYIDPVTAVMVSAFLLKEQVGFLQFAGGATVLFFTFINELDFKKFKRTSDNVSEE